MANKPKKKERVSKQDAMMNKATTIFFVGCAAELYLMLVRRYYLYGTVEQILAWDTLLKVFTVCGAVLAVGGLIWGLLWKKQGKKPLIPLAVAAAGVFFFAASGIAAWKMTTVSLLIVLVPAVMLLALLWVLYDRESALSLTILGVSVIGLYLLRKVYAHVKFGTPARVLLIAYLVALVVLVLLAKRGRLTKLLPERADLLPVYISVALSLVAILAAFISGTAAYYAIWGLAAAVFCLAVYYTVRQL